MIEFLQDLINREGIRVLLIVIVLDLIFGVLRSIKERKTNSCIGIDGMIRKIGMIISVIFLYLLDTIININLIGFLPEELKSYLYYDNLTIGRLFCLLFILFEILSIMKNMIFCKLPIPKKLQEFLNKIMEEFTGEINKESYKIIESKEVHIETPNKVEIKKEGEE